VMTLSLARRSVAALLSSVALCLASFSPLPASALTAQTITGFAPATPVLFSGGTIALTATGGGSGNPVVFASTTTSICTVSGSTVTKVALGTCTLTANQAGNATFSAAPQVTKSVVINKGTQTITFAALAAKSFVVAPFTISATASSGLAVAFTSTTTTVCTVSGASVTLVALGTCTIAANQAGNTNYSAATQVTQSFTVSKGTQTITFAALAGKGFGTAPFTVSATASSNLAVAFTSTTTPVCTVSGSTVTVVALGTCTIAANQTGNVNFNAATQVTQSFTVSKGAQTITFAALTGKALGSAPFAVSATASSGLAVVLTSTTTPVCTVAGSTVTLVTTGTCTIAANQAGNTNYNAATQITQSFAVSPAALTAQTITFAALAGKGFGSAPFTVPATASSGLAVAFTSTTTAICTVSGSTVTIVALGTCTIAANQAGNATFSAAPQVTQSFTVSKGAQTITFATLAGKTLGSAPFTVSATASSGLAVAFTSTTTPVCTVSGSTVTLVMVGTCTVAANQAGNTNYNAATQVTQSFTVSTTALIAQTITFAALAGKTLGTAPFVISASASSGLAVAFSSTTTSVCTSSGSTITLITAGTCTIAANQPGNATYSAAPQITQSFSVSNTITTIFDSPLAVGANHNCALTTGGGAKCWGENESGQLGDGTTVSKATPVDVVGLTSGVAALSAGPSHTCAITTAGGVKCWGGANRLGNGSSAGSNVPVDVVGLSSGIVAVSAGSLHTCVVTNVGSVKCWGDNSSSQLGDGTTNSQSAPVAVSGFASGATDVRAGGAHTCALTDGGGVKCWGSNYYGTLGQGSTSPSTSGTPLDVYFSGIRGVEAGSDHSCVLRGASAVACVGANYYGQIGVSAALLNFRSFPQDVAEITEALDTLAAGYSSSCVVTAAGRLKCWGSIVNSGVPVDVPPFISGVTDVGIGQAHVCVVIAGGGVRCWGSNASGQLGNNSPTGVNSTGSGVPVTVVGFSGASGIAQALTFVSPQTLNGTTVNLVATATSGLTPVFSSSTPSVCTVAGAALTVLTQGTCTVLVNQPGDGNFAAASQISQTFTINASLQTINFAALPDRSVDTGSVALDATASSGLRVVYSTTTPSVCSVTDATATLVAIGTCTITANQPGNVAFAVAPPVSRSFLVTVGSQRIMFGLLANVALGSAAPPFNAAATSALSVTYASLTPLVCTVSGNTVTTLAVGGCAVTAIQNGNASFTAARSVTQSFEIVAVNTTASPLSLTTGAGHTCAVTAAGGAKCWGANRFGKLGDGTEIDRSAPVDVIGLTSGVVAVKAGGDHTCAITNGGGVKCWGYNFYGQLGNGTTTQQSSPVDVVGLSRGVVDLALGNSHSCALLNDATVRCWGRNSSQVLGDGTNVDRNTPVPVIGLPNNIVAVRAVAYHTCALTAFGGVVCWGTNSSGQLGNGTTYSLGVAPVAMAGMGAGVTTVAPGNDFTCTLADVGSVSCVGYNYYFQLGDGTRVSRVIPAIVSGFGSGAVGLTVGDHFSCAITGVGGLTCWGNLGNQSYLIPTNIIGLASNVVQASVGYDHACAINAQATVSCFGSNSNGQLGNGTTVSAVSPVVVTGFPASTMLMQSIQFAPIPDQTVSSPAFPLKAVASSGLPVSFASLTPSVCTVSTNVVSLVSVGACVIAASQAGNAMYRPAFQSTRSFAITAAGTSPQVITGFSPTTPATFVPNSIFILTAVGGASGNPVVFTSTTPAVCALTGGIVTMLTVGTCSLTANQAGNATYAAATQVTVNVVIAKANQTITFAAITDKTVPDSPVTVSATSSSALAVVFTSTTTPVCTVTGTVVTLVATGVCTIAANQSGNISYNAAPQVSQTFNVLSIAQSITFLALVDRAVGETFVVDASSSIGLPVVFSSTTPTVCSVSGTSVVSNAVGTCTIAANQPGNVTYGPAAQVTRSFAVRPLQSISGFTPPASVAFAAGTTVTLSASASSGQIVTFASLSTDVCTVSGNVVTFIGTGACEIQAIQVGNASFAAVTAYATILVLPAGQPANLPTLLSGSPLVAALRTDAYLARLVLGSSSPISSLTITGLPPGITYTWNGKSNVDLSGVATTAGIFSASVSATNATGVATLPVSLTVTEPLTSVTNVSTAGDAAKRVSCAVSNGGVMCWGTGHTGVPPSTPAGFVPDLVYPTGSGVSAVSVGPQHACALVGDGVECWGAYIVNFGGSAVTSVTPVPVIAQGSSVTAIATGARHSCAVTGGSVTCFGADDLHQSGSNLEASFSNDSTSRRYLQFTQTKNVTGVATGNGHTCVVINGGVKCWGDNKFGQLGVAQSITVSQSPANTAYAPVDTIAASSGVTAIAASGDNTCAIVNGGVTCWGDNRAGQLGVGNKLFYEAPVQVLPTSSGATSISTNCAVTNGGLKCWGDTTTDIIPPSSNVTTVSGFSASGSYTGGCIVVNGSVRCFGSDNQLFELGNASASFRATPSVAIASGGGVTDIAAGKQHACAVVSGGVQCWGSNTAGQLGAATPALSAKPINAIASSSKVEAVATGNSHSCAIVDGGVKCWGANDQHQLGNGTTTASSLPLTVIPAKSGVTQIAASENVTCVVMLGGTKCWGSNNITPVQYAPESSGVSVTARVSTTTYLLANGGVKELYGSNTIYVPAGGGATALVAGYFHACFVVNGGVQCIGSNDKGQLGVVGAPSNFSTPVSVIPANSGVTAIAAGNDHTCVAIQGGVKCWGQAYRAGDPILATPTTIVPAGSNVITVTVATGFNNSRIHACALADGGTYCWGNNDAGQLGAADDFQLRSLVPINRAWIPRPPAPPTISTATVSSRSITLFFTPGYDGGSPVTGYNATCSFGNFASTVTGSAGPGSSSIFFGGTLLPGTIYSCVVTETTALGTSAPSLAYQLLTPLPNPTAPSPNYVTPGPGTAIVSLTPPTSSGSSGLAYYQSTCSATGQASVTSRSSAASTSVLIDNLTPGISYDCTFSAYNLDGLGSPESAYITVLVSAGNTTVSIASPADGAVFSVPANVTINANANAGLGLSITRVDFYDGATLLGYTVAAPYTFTWVSAPQGTHAITVKAYDSLGNIAKSSVVNLTINGGANAPTITITAPANGVVSTAVAITANVTLASGAVLSKIEYFEGANSIGISSSASYAWTPLVPGIYTVTAKVTDSKGATGVSAPVIITVTDASGETITFLHNDFAGSAIAATDAAGALLWKENYTPFGDRAVKAVNATGNRQWYTGKPVDSETGLSNFGARMYDPVIGRFMGVDAVGFGEGNLHSFNRYAYGNNNPYKFVDPDGNAAVDWVHGGLTAFSFCPSICGSAFSAIDGAVYAAQGDSTGAAISFGAAAIGIVSDAGVAKVAAMAAREGAAAMKIGRETSLFAKEGIYEFKEGAQIYIGQSGNIAERLEQHIASGKLAPDAISSVKTTEVLGGKTSREVTEHRRIQEITGGKPASRSDAVSNKKDPIGPNRSDLLN
jgi:RHS repeat-associated protein